MTKQQTKLVELMQAANKAKQELHEQLKKVLKPTTTGYLHSEEDWGIGSWEEDGRLRATLTPPEHAYTLSSSATAEHLAEIQEALGCEHLSVSAARTEYTQHGARTPLHYVATWKAQS